VVFIFSTPWPGIDSTAQGAFFLDVVPYLLTEFKTIFIGAFLKGITVKWFKPYIKRYYKYNTFITNKLKSKKVKQKWYRL
jgi:hypothetical protein